MHRDFPLRETIRAGYRQRCQKCWRDVELGEYVTQYPAGWCHKTCNLRPVHTTAANFAYVVTAGDPTALALCV